MRRSNHLLMLVPLRPIPLITQLTIVLCPSSPTPFPFVVLFLSTYSSQTRLVRSIARAHKPRALKLMYSQARVHGPFSWIATHRTRNTMGTCARHIMLFVRLAEFEPCSQLLTLGRCKPPYCGRLHMDCPITRNDYELVPGLLPPPLTS